MKDFKNTLIAVAVGATLFFPGQSNGELFKRLKARRTTRVVYNASPQTCVGPSCDTPTDGQLTTNKKGGFDGQLPDSTYADYLAKQNGFAKKTGASTPVEGETITVETNPVEAALVAVEHAEAALAEAKSIAERAVVEQKRAEAKQVMAIKQQIAQLKIDFQNQIDGLEAEQTALEPDEN